MKRKRPTVTLKEFPELYLKNRAHRLSKLISLNAPSDVLESEIRLVETAIQAYRAKLTQREIK